jgi:hypothetical protein
MTEVLTDWQWASFDWEALLPILFFVIYAISQVVGGKKKGDEETLDPEEEETDAMERARQIREEIRRKIAERQGGGSERSTGTAQAAPAPRSSYDPTVPEPLQRNQPAPVREPVPPPRAAPVPQPATVEPAAASSDDGGILKRLHEQRRRLAEARREQEKARQSARAMENRAFAKTSAQQRKKSMLVEAPAVQSRATGVRSALLADLTDPVSIRKAIVLREVLDKPVGLR